ncbi:MAG: glycosyltransferase family 39 protein [Ardenticatenaceae bacterium]
MTSTIIEKTSKKSSILEAPAAATRFAASTEESTISEGLTLETALWVLLAVVALGMRVIGLSYAPLSEGEAGLAYEAWRFAGGESYDMSGGVFSPLVFNLDALFFALFSASDLTARIAQLFGGTALILAPWLLRPLLGRGQALAMSALLLVSPSVLFWSRQASGEIWAALCALLLVAGVARWWRWRRERDGMLAALALGVGLASAPGFWSVLAAGGLFWLWQGRNLSPSPTSRGNPSRLPNPERLPIEVPEEHPPEGGGNSEPLPKAESDGDLTRRERQAKKRQQKSKSKDEASAKAQSSSTKNKTQKKTASAKAARDTTKSTGLRYGSVALAAFVLTATGFLSNLQGLGAAFNLPVRWLLALFGLGPSLVMPFFFVVVLYEILPLLMATVGGVRMMGSFASGAEGEIAPLWARFGFLWVGITLIPATLTNSGWAAGVLFVTVPLTLLASRLVSDLIRNLFEEGRWIVDGLLMLLGLGLFVYFWINLASYIRDPQPFKIASLLIPPIAWVATSVVLASTYNLSEVRRGLGLTLLLLLTLISFTNSWGVSIERAADPREPLVVLPTSPSLETAAEQVTQISIERYRHPAKIPLGIQRTLGYAPRWYFRHFENITLVDGSHAGLPEASLLDSQQPPPPQADIGQRIWIGTSWQWPISEAVPFLRWLKMREEPAGIIERTAILYVILP